MGVSGELGAHKQVQLGARRGALKGASKQPAFSRAEPQASAPSRPAPPPPSHAPRPPSTPRLVTLSTRPTPVPHFRWFWFRLG